MERDHNNSSSSSRGGDEVEIVLKTIGPSRPSRLKVPSRIRVRDLRNMIAANGHLPIEHLKVILRGETLNDNKNGEDVYIWLKDGDCLIVAVKPNPPAKHVRDGFDDDDGDDGDDLKFQIPQSASRWKKRLFSYLHDKLKLPSKPRVEL